MISRGQTSSGCGDVRLRFARISGAAGVLSRVANAATRLITIPLALRALGVEQYGIWLTLISFLAWLSLSDLGLPSALINPLSAAIAKREDNRIRSLISAATALLLVMGLAITLLCGILLLTPVLPKIVGLRVHSSQVIDLRIAAFAILAFTIGGICFRVPTMITSAMQRGYWSATADIASQVITVVLIILFCPPPATVARFAICMTLPPLVSRLALWVYIVLRNGACFYPKLSCVRRAEIKELGGHGLMFSGGAWAEMLVMTSPNLILAHTAGPSAVPLYAVPFQCFFTIYSCSTMISSPLWPAYVEASASGDHDWIANTLRRTSAQVLGVTALACSGLALVSQPVIALWAGAQVAPSLTLAWLLAALMTVWTWGFLNLTALTALGCLRQRVVITSLHAVCNVALSLFLARRFGPTGLALGALTAMLCTETWMIPYAVYRNAPWVYRRS